MKNLALKNLLAVATVSAGIFFAATVAGAQERLGDGAMGAVAGAVVGGPVGAFAGGVIGIRLAQISRTLWV
jgi:hypothetical protein